jgi:cysteine dioxygenase
MPHVSTGCLTANSLQPLTDYLENLQGPASLPELTAHLRQLDVQWQDVAKFVRFSERGYTRNLICGGEWFHLLVLCWKNGQRSPIHDHHGSSCGVRVLRGVMTETLFDFAPNGLVRAQASKDYLPGSVIGSRDSDMHQVSNLQAGDADLVTLHCYSPPLLFMGTYSLTSAARGTEPMFVEYCDAGGI